MKYYIYPLLFLVALSVSPVGAAFAGDEPKSKREIATPSSDSKKQQSLNEIIIGLVVELKGNEKLVLKGGGYIVRQRNGAVLIVDDNGKVKRTFRQGEIHKNPKGKVFILTKTEKVGVGRYKGIETIEPGKDAPTASSGPPQRRIPGPQREIGGQQRAKGSRTFQTAASSITVDCTLEGGKKETWTVSTGTKGGSCTVTYDADGHVDYASCKDGTDPDVPDEHENSADVVCHKDGGDCDPEFQSGTGSCQKQ